MSDDDEIEQGNPDLDPYRSTNWDFSVQNYHETLGTFSAAVFFKDIRDFIYQQTLPVADTATGFDLITYRKGSEGSILGLELGWQRALVAGFGLAVSGTWTDGEATVLGTERRKLLDALPGEVRYNNVDVVQGFLWRAARSISRCFPTASAKRCTPTRSCPAFRICGVLKIWMRPLGYSAAPRPRTPPTGSRCGAMRATARSLPS